MPPRNPLAQTGQRGMLLHGPRQAGEGAQSRLRLAEKVCVAVHPVVDERGVDMRDAVAVQLEIDAHQRVLVAVLRTPLVEGQV